MAKANLITTADIQVTAREMDFVTRFEQNWEHLRDILGIMRPIRKQPGSVLKSKYVEGTLLDGKVGEYIVMARRCGDNGIWAVLRDKMPRRLPLT